MNPFAKNVNASVAAYVIAITMLSACGGAATTTAAPDPTATDTAPSRDIESFGNPESEVAVVVAQGGPATILMTNTAEQLLGDLDLDQVHGVNVHQVQTADPDRFLATDLTFDEAIAADSESVDALEAAVAGLKEAGKEVYVVGISFGAFVVQDLLARGGEQADGYLIMVGRLDMPAEVWESFADGEAAGFVNGTQIITVPMAQAGMGAATPEGDRNMARLAAGLGHKRYTELLADIDLSSVVYVSGLVDEQVGRLTDAEIAFLEAGAATVIIGDGDHGDTVDDHIGEGLSLVIGPELVSG